MTFGMPPWHLDDEVNADKQKSKEALQSQSPIAAFKACNMMQALGIAYSKIVLPSVTLGALANLSCENFFRCQK